MFPLLGGVLLGWSLGTNDAANVFGTAVASRIVRYRTAIILTSIFVITGAALQGTGGIKTLSGLTSQNAASAGFVCLAAALTVTVMTALKLPASASHAVVGAIIGRGLMAGAGAIQWWRLVKMLICWVGTPTGAAVAAIILYPLLAWGLDRMKLSFIARSMVLKAALVVSGCYGAYALGANNVANVTGGFWKTTGLPFDIGNDLLMLAIVGGASIALGVLTYSRNVMMTVGSRFVELDAFSALVAVLAMAVTVHFYAQLNVPVSTSQAIVGGVLGIGIVKGVKTINRRTLVNIFLGWVSTPLIAGVLSFVMTKLFL